MNGRAIWTIVNGRAIWRMCVGVHCMDTWRAKCEKIYDSRTVNKVKQIK